VPAVACQSAQSSSGQTPAVGAAKPFSRPKKCAAHRRDLDL
jgi:hypothetical protein